MRLYTQERGARGLEDPRVGVRARGRALPGQPPEWEGWDDAAVAPEKLGGYLRDIRKLLDEYQYQTAFYGHFGHGCIHMRVSFDLQSESGIRKYGEFVERAADLVVSYGGSLSGEHGDGQSRGALLPKMFGPELMQAFGEFKSAWDPGNQMNPHKVVECLSADRESAAWARTTSRCNRRRIFNFRTMAARLPKPRCAASASANAANSDGGVDVSQLHGDARGGAQHARPRAHAV